MYSLVEDFYDGKQIMRQPGEEYYDGKYLLRRPGEEYYDYSGILRLPNEDFYDGKGYLCGPDDEFCDGKGQWVRSGRPPRRQVWTAPQPEKSYPVLDKLVATVGQILKVAAIGMLILIGLALLTSWVE